MDDLNNLMWGSGSNKSQNQKNNTSLNAMRGVTPKKSTTLSTSQTSTSTPSNSSNQNIFHSQAINANSPVFKRFNNNNSSDSSNPNLLSTFPIGGKKVYSLNSPSNNTTPSISPSLTPTSNNNSVESLDGLLPFNKKVTNLSLAEKRKLQEQEQQRKLQEEHERLKKHYDQSQFWDSLEGKSSNSQGNNGSGLNIQKSPQQTGDIFDDILSGANQYGTSESIS